MSAASTAWAWGVPADPKAKLVLLWVADLCGPNHWAAVGFEDMRRATGLTGSEVEEALTALESANRISMKKKGRGALREIWLMSPHEDCELRRDGGPAPAEHGAPEPEVPKGLTKAQAQAIERAEKQGLRETLALIVEHGGGKAREGTAAYAKLARDFLKSRADYTLGEIHAALKLKLAADYIKREHKTPSSLLRPSTLPEWVERADQQKADQAKIDSSPELVRRQIIEEIGKPGLDRLGFITAAQGSSSEFAREKGTQAETWFRDQGIRVEIKDGRAVIVGRLP